MKANFTFRAGCLIVLMFFVTGIYSQVVTINNLIPISGTDDDFITDQASDGEQNVIIGGTYLSEVLNFDTLGLESANNAPSPFYQSDVFIAKYSVSGTIQWAVSGGGNYADKLTALATDAEGNTWFTGYFGSDVFEMDTFSLSKKSITGVDMFIGMLDSEGTPVWIKNFGSEYDTWPRDICPGNNGEVYAIGEFTGDSMLFDTAKVFLSGTYGFADVFIIRMDGSGKVLKAVTIEGDSEDLASAVVFGNNKVIIGVNHYSSVINFGSTELVNRGMYDAFIGVMDQDLVPIAARDFSGNRQDFVYGIDISSQGDIVAAGSFKSDTLYIDDQQFINPTSTDDIKQYDIFLAHYDEDLNLERSYSYGQLPNDDATAVRFDSQGNILLGGTTVSPSLQFGSHEIVHSGGTAGYTDLFLVKIDADGDGVWSSVIYSGLDDENLTVNLLSDNDFVVTGNYRGTTLQAGILTVDNSGDEGAYEPFIALGSVSQANSLQETDDGRLMIVPNPAHSVMHLLNVPSDLRRIQVIDMSGRVVKESKIENSEINVENLDSGIYILKAITAEGGQAIRFAILH